MHERLGLEQDTTLPVLIFNALAKSAGNTVLRQVFEHAGAAFETGDRGVALEDTETASWTLSVEDVDGDRSVNFHFHGWGPLTLPLEVAEQVLDTSEQIDQALRENAD